MNKKLSIIIPTLQKDLSILSQLLNTLANDSAVGEIIVIDNSTKGLNFNNPKLRVITPETNLFVNPSWNLGVREAKYHYIGILNDDICIPQGFCSKIIEDISSDIGIIGTNGYSMIDKTYEPEKITNNSYRLEKTSFTTFNFGVMLFFHKDNYYEIPNDIKIFFGDDYLVFKNKKNHKTNYVIEDLMMYHYGSLSSHKYSDIVKQEASLYRRHTLTILDRLLSYEKTRSRHLFRILGFCITIKRDDIRYHNRINKIYGDYKE